jgi:hypothetical protein
MSVEPVFQQNLVLKWRQDARHPLLKKDRLLVPSSYSEDLERGRNQLCVIYVPSRGSPENRELQGCHIATAILSHFEADPEDANAIVLHLIDTRPFEFPVPFAVNGFVLETGKIGRTRDHPREQKAVRFIERPNLQRIMRFGASGADLSSDVERSDLRDEGVQTGFEEPHGDGREVHPRVVRADILRNPAVVRETYALDKSQCVLTGHSARFRGLSVCLEAAHLLPLRYDGPDDVSNTALLHKVLHDLYDRFAFTFSDDFEVVWAKDANPSLLAPGLVIRKRAIFLRPAGRMPHLSNIRWHRDKFLQLERSSSSRP